MLSHWILHTANTRYSLEPAKLTLHCWHLLYTVSGELPAFVLPGTLRHAQFCSVLLLSSPSRLRMSHQISNCSVQQAVEEPAKHRQMPAFCWHCTVTLLLDVCAGVTPGYKDEVIFADGTFIDGSTSELSADGPIRPPYTVYCQGGTHWTHWAFALESALEAIQAVHD